MRYTTFRNMALAGGVLLLGGTGYMCSRSSPQQPRQVTTATPAAAVPAARTPAALPAQPSDYRTYLLGTLGKPANGDRIKDALGRGQVKVNVYAEGGRWARAKVDLNRNEKWEEKWWVENGSVMRAVSPEDNESYGDKTREGPAAN